MKVFVASSWKNREKVRDMSIRLRRDGHKVYDFTDSECRKVQECPPEKQQGPFDQSKHKSYSAYLRTANYMYAAVMNNQEEIRKCDLLIMLLPCGNDTYGTALCSCSWKTHNNMRLTAKWRTIIFGNVGR